MDGTAQILQTPGAAVCISGVQNVGGVKWGAHAAVVQHHVASLHAFTVSSSRQGLIEAFKVKTSSAVTKDLTGDPSASAGACLFGGHGRVVHHVVDGAEKWWNLPEEKEIIWVFPFSDSPVSNLSYSPNSKVSPAPEWRCSGFHSCPEHLWRPQRNCVHPSP